MKNLFYLLFVLPLLFSCGDGAKEMTDEELDTAIMASTYTSGYYNLWFKNDHTIQIFQRNKGDKYSKGCMAEGKWSIENSQLKVEVTRSFCPSETYVKFNGLYTLSEDKKCISNKEHSFCKKY